MNYIILDHFGSNKIRSKHLLNLIEEQNDLIFLTKRKINKSKYKLLNYLNLKIASIKKFNLKSKKNLLLKREIFLGDTDIFITI